VRLKISDFEFKKLGEDRWQKASEKMVLEKLIEYFDPITPVLMRMFEGNEIVTRREIYRVRN
jgi:hypothetical protein